MNGLLQISHADAGALQRRIVERGLYIREWRVDVNAWRRIIPGVWLFVGLPMSTGVAATTVVSDYGASGGARIVLLAPNTRYPLIAGKLLAILRCSWVLTTVFAVGELLALCAEFFRAREVVSWSNGVEIVRVLAVGSVCCTPWMLNACAIAVRCERVGSSGAIIASLLGVSWLLRAIRGPDAIHWLLPLWGVRALDSPTATLLTGAVSVSLLIPLTLWLAVHREVR